MKLFYQTHSPYARKAAVFAHEAGLADQVEVIHHETSPTWKNDEVFAANPLGKVPVLLRENGDPLFDSDVICAFLDTLHEGPRLIPEHGEPRWRALRFQALAQGLCNSGIAYRWETVRRPEELRLPVLAEGYALKLNQSYDWLEQSIQENEPLNIGHIALATALSWLEFRELPSFRPNRPQLVRWLGAFENRPSMKATPLTGTTVDQIKP